MGGRASLETVPGRVQSLAEDALPFPCALDGFLGWQEAVRRVARLCALGSGPVTLLSWGMAEVSGCKYKRGAEAGETWMDTWGHRRPGVAGT